MSIHCKVDSKVIDVPVDTKSMNVVELACTFGQTKLVTFLLQDLCMISRVDLELGSKQVHEMFFLMSPILKKD
jgi:hypothetical protein